jgi:hypothetical protein
VLQVHVRHHLHLRRRGEVGRHLSISLCLPESSSGSFTPLPLYGASASRGSISTLLAPQPPTIGDVNVDVNQG